VTAVENKITISP